MVMQIPFFVLDRLSFINISTIIMFLYNSVDFSFDMQKAIYLLLSCFAGCGLATIAENIQMLCLYYIAVSELYTIYSTL